jgi:hypothetical protein
MIKYKGQIYTKVVADETALSAPVSKYFYVPFGDNFAIVSAPSRTVALTSARKLLKPKAFYQGMAMDVFQLPTQVAARIVKVIETHRKNTPASSPENGESDPLDQPSNT